MNESGVTPIGRRVLVKPDAIEKQVGSIILPELELGRHEQAISTGYLIAVGEDAWVHGVEDYYDVVNGQLKWVSRRVDRRLADYPQPGERVVFAKFGGKEIPGVDGEKYRLLNDEDVTALAAADVRFGNFDQAREPMSKVAS
jgi:chaperonin GroES